MYKTKESWSFNSWKDKFTRGLLSPLFVVQHRVRGLPPAGA